MNGLPTSLRIAGTPPASMGGLTYDPSPVPQGAMAANALANILGLIEAERQKRAEQNLLKQIFQEAGVIPQIGAGQEEQANRPIWKRAFDIFNPNLPPSMPTPMQSKLANALAVPLLQNKLEMKQRGDMADRLGLTGEKRALFIATGKLPQPAKGIIRELGNKLYKINPVTGQAEVIAEAPEPQKQESIEERLKRSALEKMMMPATPQVRNLPLDVGGITPQFQNIPIVEQKRPALNEAERAVLRAKGFIKEPKQPQPRDLTPYQKLQAKRRKDFIDDLKEAEKRVKKGLLTKERAYEILSTTYPEWDSFLRRRYGDEEPLQDLLDLLRNR